MDIYKTTWSSCLHFSSINHFSKYDPILPFNLLLLLFLFAACIVWVSVYMCVRECVCIVSVCLHMYECMCVFVYILECVCVSEWMYVWENYMRVWECVCEMVCVCAYAYMCVRFCVCDCVCVCLSTMCVGPGMNLYHQAWWQLLCPLSHFPSSHITISMSSSILLYKCPHYLLNKFPSLPLMLQCNQERCSGMAICAWLPGPLLFVSFTLNLRLSALGSKTLNAFYLYFRCMSIRMAVSHSSWVTLVWPQLLMAPCTQSVAPQHMWLLKSLQRLGECSPLALELAKE